MAAASWERVQGVDLQQRPGHRRRTQPLRPKNAGAVLRGTAHDRTAASIKRTFAGRHVVTHLHFRLPAPRNSSTKPTAGPCL